MIAIASDSLRFWPPLSFLLMTFRSSVKPTSARHFVTYHCTHSQTLTDCCIPVSDIASRHLRSDTRHRIGHFRDGGPWAVMCISHSVMEGQRHNNPLNLRCFCLQRHKREATKALGGSFKLVTLVPKTVREMTQLLRETSKNGVIQTNQKAQMNTQSTNLG